MSVRDTILDALAKAGVDAVQIGGKLKQLQYCTESLWYLEPYKSKVVNGEFELLPSKRVNQEESPKR